MIWIKKKKSSSHARDTAEAQLGWGGGECEKLVACSLPDLLPFDEIRALLAAYPNPCGSKWLLQKATFVFLSTTVDHLTFASIVLLPIRGCDERGRKSGTTKLKKAQGSQSRATTNSHIEWSPGCKLGQIDGRLMPVLSALHLSILHV